MSGGMFDEPMASLIVCHGSLGSRVAISEVLEGRREGEAESVRVAVPMGARPGAGCGELLLEVLLELEMMTELRRRGW